MTYLGIRNIILGLIVNSLIVSAAYAKDISINFIANASVRITDGEYVLFTDFPYVSGSFGHMVYTYPYFVEQNNNVTTLITSRLADHFDPDVFLTLGWKIIAPNEVATDLQNRYNVLSDARDKVIEELERNRKIEQALVNISTPPNVSPDQTITAATPQRVELVVPEPIIKPKIIAIKKSISHGPMHITSINTGETQVEHYAYLLEWGGKKIYFSGDTGDTDHMATLPELDVAFISPWLFENARKNDAFPNAKTIIIYQHKDNEIIPNCFDCIVPMKGQYIPLD